MKRNFIFSLLMLASAVLIAQVPATSNQSIPKPTAKDLLNKTQPVSTQQSSNQPASSLITDGKEPAGLKGYIAWTDPESGKRNYVKGRDNNTGQWIWASEYPSITIIFQNTSGQQQMISLSNGGDYYVPVDSVGNVLPRSAGSWTTVNPPVGFRYDIQFRFDESLTGIPVKFDQHTIRYNPNTWKFYDVRVDQFFNPNVTVPLEDFPELPALLKRRTAKFVGLPDF